MLAAGLLAAALASFLWPTDEQPATYRVAIDQLTPGMAHWYRPFNLGVDEGGRPYGIWLVRSLAEDGESGGLLALLARDPHNRPGGPCAVTTEGDDGLQLLPFPTVTLTPLADGRTLRDTDEGFAFRAYCSGSGFAADGTRLFGPAPRGLDRLPVEIRGGEALIDFSRVELGPCSDGIQFDSGTCPYSQPGEPKYQRAIWPGVFR